MKFSLFNISSGRSELPTMPTGRAIKSAIVQPHHARIIREVNSRMVRMYEAAVTNNLNSDFPVSITSANAELLTSIIATRSRARRLERDNPYGAELITIHQNNVVGHDPFRLEMKVGKKNKDGAFEKEDETNSKIEDWWKEAGEPENCTVRRDMSRAELYWMGISSLVRDGGLLCRHRRMYPHNPFGYAIEPIEMDRLDPFWNRPQVGTANEIQFSIEMDDWHAPIAFHILTRHPGDVFAWSNQTKYRERVPADEIICLHAIRTRAGQYIGISKFSSIIQRLHRLDQYDIAEITAAIWASAKPFFLTKDLPTGAEYVGDKESKEGETVSISSPGEGEVLPEGFKPVLVDPKHPVEAYPNFTKQNLRAVAAGGGVAYHTLANDLEGVNFSSGRLGENVQRDEFKKLQKHMITNLVRPHFREALKHALMSGKLELPLGRLDEFVKAAHFHGKRWPYVNPLQDAQADILRIESGLTSRSRIIAESDRGGDVEDVDSEIASDKLVDEAHELDFSGSDVTTPTIKKGVPGQELPNPEDGGSAPPAKTGGKQTIKSKRGNRLAAMMGSFNANGHSNGSH